ncbi:MAG: hypothetical protein ACPG51_20785 [Thiolinea sp.]
MFNKKTVLSLALASALSVSASTATAGTMLGAFIKNDGWSLTELDKFNADTSKKMAVTTLFSTFDMHWDILTARKSSDFEKLVRH